MIARGATRDEARRAAARGAGGDPHRRHRDQLRVPAAVARRPEPSRRRRATPGSLDDLRLRAAHDRGARRRARRRPCRTTRGGSATGTSACRRRGRWTRCRSGSQPAGRQRRRRRRAGVHADRPDAALSRRATVVALTGADMGATLDGAPVARFRRRSRSPAGSVLRLGAVSGAGQPRLPRGARRHRRAAVSRQPRDLHAGRVRRPRRPRAARRRRAAPRARRRAESRRHARAADDARSRARPTSWEIAVLTARTRRPDFFTPEDIDDALRHRLEGPLQLRPHRRAPDRPEAALGAPRRRRGGAAPLQHPRQRLRHRHASTSPATCRSSSAPTVRAWAASSVRRRSSQAELWKIGPAQGRRHRPLPSRSRSTRPAAQARAGARSHRDAARPDAPPRPRGPSPTCVVPSTRCADRARAPRADETRPRCYPPGRRRNLLVEYGPLGARSRICASASTRCMKRWSRASSSPASSI